MRDFSAKLAESGTEPTSFPQPRPSPQQPRPPASPALSRRGNKTDGLHHRLVAPINRLDLLLHPQATSSLSPPPLTAATLVHRRLASSEHPRAPHCYQAKHISTLELQWQPLFLLPPRPRGIQDLLASTLPRRRKPLAVDFLSPVIVADPGKHVTLLHVLTNL